MNELKKYSYLMMSIMNTLEKKKSASSLYKSNDQENLLSCAAQAGCGGSFGNAFRSS